MILTDNNKRMLRIIIAVFPFFSTPYIVDRLLGQQAFGDIFNSLVTTLRGRLTLIRAYIFRGNRWHLVRGGVFITGVALFKLSTGIEIVGEEFTVRPLKQTVSQIMNIVKI